MNNEIIKLAKQISDWCLDNNSEKFHCFFSYSGHVNVVGVRLISGGYDAPVEEFAANHNGCTVPALELLFGSMKTFKENHDSEFSEERQTEVKERNKVERIAAIKAELSRLESEEK